MAASKIVIVVVVIAVVGVAVWLILNKNPNLQPAPADITPASTNRAIVPPAQPTPSPISKQVPTPITTDRGTVQSVDKSTLIIKTASNTVTLSIANTTDVQKLTSGTLEKGDAKTAPAKITDVAVGQEVLAVVDKGTSNVRSLLIIK